MAAAAGCGEATTTAAIGDSIFPPGPLPPLLQNTTSLQTAIRQNTVGIGYSGSGMLLFYFIGVSKVLQQLGVIKPGQTRIAATSGGIIGCAPDIGVVDHDRFLEVGKEFVTRCRDIHNCAGTLDSEVARVVDQLLGPDAHQKVNNTAFLTFASPNGEGIPVGDFVSTYSSRDDLAEAIRAGTYLPIWSGPSLTRPFRGKASYDGGFRRQLPCPPDVTYCITSSVLPPLDLGEMVKAAMQPETMRALSRAVSSTVGTNPVKFVTNFAMKWRQAQKSAHSQFRMSEVIYGSISYLLSVNPGKGVHIWPGKYHKNPYPFWEWMLMMVIPPTPQDIDVLVDMGIKDATAWAQEQGLMPQAGKHHRRAAA